MNKIANAADRDLAKNFPRAGFKDSSNKKTTAPFSNGAAFIGAVAFYFLLC